MDKHLEVMKNIMALSDTTYEAFEYIKDKVCAENLESLYIMIYDAINSIYRMQLAVLTFIQKLPSNNLEALTAELNQGLDLLVSACERNEAPNAYSALNDTLLQAYANWQNELKANMNQYTLS